MHFHKNLAGVSESLDAFIFRGIRAHFSVEQNTIFEMENMMNFILWDTAVVILQSYA